jgi:hypothetical protein
LLLFIASQAKPILVFRYLLPSVPALCLILAISLSLFPTRWALVGGVAVALSFTGYALKADVLRTNPSFPNGRLHR